MNQLKWQTIIQRRDYFTTTHMYRCVHDMAPAHLMNKLVMTADTHDRNTRSDVYGNIQVPKPICELCRNSCRYQGAMLWNSLSSEPRNANDIPLFKFMYKKAYFQQPLGIVHASVSRVYTSSSVLFLF